MPGGATGKGGGPVSEELKTRVPDLTALARNNNGVFPFDRVSLFFDSYPPGTANPPPAAASWP